MNNQGIMFLQLVELLHEQATFIWIGTNDILNKFCEGK